MIFDRNSNLLSMGRQNDIKCHLDNDFVENNPIDGKIYRILNKVNGKTYIGQTITSLEERWKKHKSTSGCKALSCALKKYGIDNSWVIKICKGKQKTAKGLKFQYYNEEING